MTTTVPYWFIQNMVEGELQFLKDNVYTKTSSYFSFGHLRDRLTSLLKIVNSANSTFQQYDSQILKLLINNMNKIQFTYSNETKPVLKQRLLDQLPNGALISNKYDKELNKVFNYSYNSQINTLDNIQITHLQLACVLCYTAIFAFRNNMWLLSQNENYNLFTTAFGNYLYNFLSMLHKKDKPMSNYVRVVYHVVPLPKTPLSVTSSESMSEKLVTVTNAQYQSKPTDIEVCYAMHNKLFLNNPEDQQTELCAQFLELNAIPYCLYNAELPDNFGLSVFNLYKLDQNTLKLGNVMFVNTMRTAAREVKINTLRMYVHMCRYIVENKLKLRVVGNYKGYQNDYKMAALDFVLLMFATNAHGCPLNYLMMNKHETMFIELKRQACRMTFTKLFDVIMNYNIDLEPLTNFSANIADTEFR